VGFIEKPLGYKNYGSIGHLPNSRMGPGDHHVHDGQMKICLEKQRDKNDLILVTEKLDGTNVGVAMKDGQILALQRKGYLADSSPHKMHRAFADWVRANEERFRVCLRDGERIVGEWLAVAHGTIYKLPHEPFVVFDMFHEQERYNYAEVKVRCAPGNFTHPRLIHVGGSFPMDRLLVALETSGHGAVDGVEGAVYRIERKGKVDFLAKWVRPDKIDGKYLNTESHPCEETWLWQPTPRLNGCDSHD
jgi:hypothetical protein